MLTIIAMHPYNIAIPTRPAATATPAAITNMCSDVAGDAGAAPFATADDADALTADDADDKILDETELKEADTEDGNGLAASTSLVYMSMYWLPALSQNACTGVGIAVNQDG